MYLKTTDFKINSSGRTRIYEASCSDGFCSSCLDKNLVYSWNHPLGLRLTSKYNYVNLYEKIVNTVLASEEQFIVAKGAILQ